MITYPSNIKTDKDKLAAVYSLVEQLRLEHNSQGAIWGMDKTKWALYSGRAKHFGGNIFDRKLQPLLAEQNRLRQAILDANYTIEQWNKLTEEQQEEAKLTLWGDKETLKLQPTLATSSEINELKAVDLSKITGQLPPDPVEDFTTYTETDPNSKISKTATRVTFTGLETDVDAYVYDDKGVNHFDGDFEHLLTVYIDAITSSGNCTCWALANVVNDIVGIEDANGDHLCLLTGWVGAFIMQIRECDGGDVYVDNYFFSLDTLYYLKIKRDEAVGANGTIYCYIYSDSDRTILVDTLSVALHTSKKDFRYVYGVMSNNTGDTNDTITGYTENLDLQEGGGATFITRVCNF